jgi:hypothetical protein
MSIVNWLRSAMGIAVPTMPPTRLSAEQAIQIARAAAQHEPFCSELTMTTVRERDGALVWSVGAAIVGKSLRVEIDDATGKVLGVFSGGVR